MIRKVPETASPIIWPALWTAGKLGDDRPRCEDEREGQDEDDRGVPKGKPHAHGERTLSVLEQFARRIVDGDDVIRIHPVPQAKRVSEESEPCEDGG